MFVQVIQGRVRDSDAAHRHLVRWCDEVCRGAAGLLGATAGVTDDGWLFLVARFRSPGDVGVHSERPEQSAWWAELVRMFDGPATLHDCNDVALIGDGDARGASVQIVQARDVRGEPLPTIVAGLDSLLRRQPGVVGCVLARAEDGTVTEVTYLDAEAGASGAGGDTAPDDATAHEELGGDPQTVRSYLLRAPLLVAQASEAGAGAMLRLSRNTLSGS